MNRHQENSQRNTCSSVHTSHDAEHHRTGDQPNGTQHELHKPREPALTMQLPLSTTSAATNSAARNRHLSAQQRARQPPYQELHSACRLCSITGMSHTLSKN